MKRIFIAVVILIGTFLMGAAITARAYSWKHSIGAGLSSGTGVPLRVESDGTLYIRD